MIHVSVLIDRSLCNKCNIKCNKRSGRIIANNYESIDNDRFVIDADDSVHCLFDRLRFYEDILMFLSRQ